MTDNLKKLKIIYTPFLIMAVLFIAIYTFLNWLILIELELFSIKDGIINVGVPLALLWLPMLLWLRPKLEILNLERERGSLISFYLLICWFAIAIPTIIARKYIETASGELSEIHTVNEIGNQSKTKYYQISKYYIDKVNIGVNTTFDVSGKYSNDFNMHIYIAMPIFEKAADTLKPTCFAWYGKEYYKRISNRLEESEKEDKYQEFANESQIDFDNFNPAQFIYLDRIGNSGDREGLLEAAKKSRKFSKDYQTILLPINESFENRNGNKLTWVFGSFGIGAIIWLIMILMSKIDTKELKKTESEKPIKEEGLDDFIGF